MTVILESKFSLNYCRVEYIDSDSLWESRTSMKVKMIPCFNGQTLGIISSAYNQ